MSSLCSLLRHARAYNYKTGGPPPKLSSLPWFLNNMKTVQFFCPDKNTSDKRKKERKKERKKGTKKERIAPFAVDKILYNEKVLRNKHADFNHNLIS